MGTTKTTDSRRPIRRFLGWSPFDLSSRSKQKKSNDSYTDLESRPLGLPNERLPHLVPTDSECY